jgi:hypothetical protein
VVVCLAGVDTYIPGQIEKYDRESVVSEVYRVVKSIEYF